MSNFHFLRPGWLILILLILGLLWFFLRQSSGLNAWAAVCDSHLLKHLTQSKGQRGRHFALICLFISLLFMCFSLAGPTWARLPVPTYKQIQPRVLVLDLSDSMLINDLKPNRLTRAKFKLHDLFARPIGQFGLIAYTGEPFVVAPLTDDAQTIDSLLSSLSPEIMPVAGQKLDLALEEAARLIANAGFKEGQILVLSGETPSLEAIETAKNLAKKQIYTSVMPITGEKTASTLFNDLAQAGEGEVIPFSDRSIDLDRWLEVSGNQQKFTLSNDDDIPVWRDEGRWFLIPALALLLPIFRRGWLQRIGT
ncbi:MAG: VWA domain-containing protein [Tatlockia sp.]|nr:VWA domain-containing protein [Tatlockia sp.]